MKDYLKDLKQGVSQLDLLLAAKNLNETAEFYIEETKLVRDMCKEYYSYVMGGHILDTLLGNYREEDDLVDYRTLPFKLF